MHQEIWLFLLLLFSTTGCTFVSSDVPKAADAPRAADISRSANLPRSVQPSATTPVTSIPPVTTTPPVAITPSVDAASPTDSQTAQIQQDYAPTEPLPDTGKLTIRDNIRNLEPNRLIADCPSDSGPYAFAESTHYRVQICSQEYDPWQPKYYIGQAKDGSGELRITSTDPDQARQLIFKHEGYTYILYRDGARPEQVNAYLEVYFPNGERHAEALLWLYEIGRPPG